jgi:hypothetical protein
VDGLRMLYIMKSDARIDMWPCRMRLRTWLLLLLGDM